MQSFYDEDTKFDMVSTECKEDYGTLKMGERATKFFISLKDAGFSLLLFPRW